MYLSRASCLALVVVAGGLLVGSVVGDRGESSRSEDPAEHVVEPVTVVDVARGVEASELPALVRIRADERVIAVDDQPVANDLAAGAAIARRGLGAGKFLDLTVGGAHGRRRVLVLMH